MDDFSLAVECWNNSQDDLRGFAKYAARVSGEQTKLLAEACKCSVDKVENYRRAYRLFYELQRYVETPDISRMWAESDVSLWVESAKLKSKYELDLFTIYNYMRDGEGMSIEAYRAHVDADCDKRPEWVRRLATIDKKLTKLETDYMSEVPPDVQAVFRNATREFRERLQGIEVTVYIEAKVLDPFGNPGAEELAEARGWVCEVCGKRRGTQRHHALFRTDRRFPMLDVAINYQLVCPVCHTETGEADSRQNRLTFYEKQCERYGKGVVDGWIDSLPMLNKDL